MCRTRGGKEWTLAACCVFPAERPVTVTARQGLYGFTWLPTGHPGPQRCTPSVTIVCLSWPRLRR